MGLSGLTTSILVPLFLKIVMWINIYIKNLYRFLKKTLKFSYEFKSDFAYI
jgi:hypothetical protein